MVEGRRVAKLLERSYYCSQDAMLLDSIEQISVIELGSPNLMQLSAKLTVFLGHTRSTIVGPLVVPSGFLTTFSVIGRQ